MPSSEKITTYSGDLVLPDLGLSNYEVEEIFSTADAIIHNGADVSYMKNYSSLRLPNMQATKVLAEMSMHRMIPFHYVSSGGACSFASANGNKSIGPTSVARAHPPLDGRLGYTSSKWASEIFLEKLKAQHPDWPIYIHRPSNIARIDTPQLDLVYNLQRYSRLLKSVPVVRGKTQGTLNSVTLDTVVGGILDAVNKTIQKEDNPKVVFLHHLGSVDFPMDNLRSWVVDKERLSTKAAGSSQQEAEFEEAPLDQWTTRAAEHGMHPALVAFMQTFGSQGGLSFPKLTK
jgi:hybrid polyketide synthase/nonribosomal peptide synthetase ACE1